MPQFHDRSTDQVLLAACSTKTRFVLNLAVRLAPHFQRIIDPTTCACERRDIADAPGIDQCAQSRLRQWASAAADGFNIYSG